MVVLPCAMLWTCPACRSDAVTRDDITVLLVVLYCEDCHARFEFRRELPPGTTKALICTNDHQLDSDAAMTSAPQPGKI